MRLEVLEKTYILGAKDSVLIVPPKIKYLIVKKQLYIDNGGKIITHPILANRFKEEIMFTLPLTRYKDNKPVN